MQHGILRAKVIMMHGFDMIHIWTECVGRSNVCPFIRYTAQTINTINNKINLYQMTSSIIFTYLSN